MASIKLQTFSGIAPRTAPKLLNDTMAQVAHNCRLKSGRLEPIKQPLEDKPFVAGPPVSGGHCRINMSWIDENGRVTPHLGIAPDAKTLHLWRFKNDPNNEDPSNTLPDNEYFLSWSGDVSVAKSTIADDQRSRLWIAGDTGVSDGNTKNVPAVLGLKDLTKDYSKVCDPSAMSLRRISHSPFEVEPSISLRDYINLEYLIEKCFVVRMAGDAYWYGKTRPDTEGGGSYFGPIDRVNIDSVLKPYSGGVSCDTDDDGTIIATIRLKPVTISRHNTTEPGVVPVGGLASINVSLRDAYLKLSEVNTSTDGVTPMWKNITSTGNVSTSMQVGSGGREQFLIKDISNEYIGSYSCEEIKIGSFIYIEDKPKVGESYVSTASIVISSIKIRLRPCFFKIGDRTGDLTWKGYDGGTYTRSSGTPMYSDSGNGYYTNYCMTWVDDWGQESPPSKFTDEIFIAPGKDVVFVTPTLTGLGGSVSCVRLYRTYQGKWRFVTEIKAGDSYPYEWHDKVSNLELGEEMPIIENPPDDLEGLICMPGGFLVGYRRKSHEICFSEPWLPYSFPTEYRLTIDYEPVAIAQSYNDVFVMTNGEPYVITGSHPDVMNIQKIAFSQSCVNRRAVTSLDGTIFYASPDGLCSVRQGGSPSIVTNNFFTRREWQDLDPSSMILTSHDTAIVCFLAHNKLEYIKSLIIDFADGKSAVTTCDDPSYCMFSDIQDDRIYFIKKDENDLQSIWIWNEGDVNKILKWRSKRFQGSTPVSYSWIRMTSDFYNAPLPKITLYTGESPVNVDWRNLEKADLPQQSSLILRSQDVRRLPIIRPERCWEVGVEHNQPIDDFIISTNSTECRV